MTPAPKITTRMESPRIDDAQKIPEMGGIIWERCSEKSRNEQYFTKISGRFRIFCVLCANISQMFPMKKAPDRSGALWIYIKRLRVGFFFLLGDFLTGFLIDHLHAQTDLATVIKAQKFHFDCLTFFQNFIRMSQALVGNL